MNQQQKEQWLAALRSGKYEQGTGYLKNKGRYCCLGVAQEACSLPGSQGFAFLYDENCDHTFLPEHLQHTLAAKNDVGTPFTEIADYIEQNIEPTE